MHLQVTNLDTDRFKVEIALPPASSFDRVRLTEFADVTYADRMRDNGYEVHLIPMRGGGLAPLKNMLAARALSALIRARRFDVVHAHSSIGGAVGRLGAIGTIEAKVVYQPNGLSFNEYVSPFRRHLYVNMERLLGRITDVFVASSWSERDQALDAAIISKDKIQVIENPIDIDELHYDNDVATAGRKSLGLPEGSLIVGTVARLVFQKGLPYFIDAIPAVVKDVPLARFVIVGDGRLRGELEERARRLGVNNHLLFLGHLPDPFPVMSSFDLFVLPSLWEGLPYAPLEAMLLGRPVVASDVTGTRDIITSGAEGLLVPPRDWEQLARSVIMLLTRPELRKRLGDAGEASVRRRFGIHQTMDKVTAMYEQLAARKPVRGAPG